MKNLICSIFGHKRIFRDWYPQDPIIHIDCLRCGDRLEERPNLAYINRNIVKNEDKKEDGKIEDMRVDIKIKENRVYVYCDNNNFQYNIDIFGDNELLYDVKNINFNTYNGAHMWFQPGKSFFLYDKIKVILYSNKINKNRDIDPYNEEIWEEDYEKLEKCWNIEYKSMPVE